MSSERTDDTIVAIATPPGRGGVGMIRISGSLAFPIATTIAGSLPSPRTAAHRALHDATGPLDSGLVLCFAAPRSYTGEDVVELQCHGSPVVLDLLVQRALELGAQPAAPGEFTQRAFLNNRLDLAEAEAVADLIDARSAAAARAAQRSLSGEFSRRVSKLALALEQLRIEVEASIDFVEEDLQLQEEAGIRSRLEHVRTDIAELVAAAGQGRLLAEGCSVVIAGRPNAGKSSLLNALSGTDAAIVTDQPGTTRDVLREQIQIDGLPVTLLDTAGLRDATDLIEAEGIRRAKASIASADHVLYLVDASDTEAVAASADEMAAFAREATTTVVYTKVDLVSSTPTGGLSISLKTGAGLSALRAQLLQLLGYTGTNESVLSARRRHLDALNQTRQCLDTAIRQAAVGATDLLAEELKLAHAALGAITGRLTSDELLGKIFASFCIGK